MYAAGKGPQFLHTLAEGRNLLFLQCSYCHFQAVIISAFTVTVARSSHYSTVGIHVRNYSYTNHHGKKKGELIVRALALDVGSKTSISITAYSIVPVATHLKLCLAQMKTFPIILLEQKIHSSPRYLNSQEMEILFSSLHRLTVLWVQTLS